MSKIKKKLVSAYSKAFNLIFDIIEVEDLQPIQAIIDANFTEYRHLIETISNDTSSKAATLVETENNKIINSFEKMGNGLTSKVEKLIEDFQKFQQNLETYRQNAKMDNNFFM